MPHRAPAWALALVMAAISSSCGGAAHSRHEDSIGLCSDGRDNDGDENVDCDDEDCWDFAICASDGGPDSDTDVDTDADSDTGSETSTGTETDTGSDCIGDPWTIEIVDSEGIVGLTPSLALDEEGAAHVAYADETTGDMGVRYATNRGGAWATRTISEMPGARSPSIGIDSDGAAHVSYVNQVVVPYDLHYATDRSGAWDAEVARTGDAFLPPPSLCVDDSSSPHVAHLRNLGAGNVWIDHSFIEAGDWTFEPVSLTQGSSLSMAIDSADTLAIVVPAPPGLSFMTNESGVWVTTPIDDVGANNPRIAVDGDDVPHVVYVDASGAVRHAFLEGAKWTFEDVDESNVGTTPSIAVGSDGSIHVSYYDQVARDLLYATNRSGAWAIETAEDDGDAGGHSSIAVDARGRPWIAYWQLIAPDESDLRVAHRCE